MAFYRVCGNYYGTDNDANSLMHYRTPGSKNGVRKYQYEDGTLTPAGKIHYGIGVGSKGGPVSVPQAMINSKKNYFTPEYDYGYGKYFDPTSSDIRFKSGKAIQKNLAKDARPTGINKALYDASVRARQASADISKAVDDAKTWVGDRASDVKNWGEQAGRDAGKAVNDAKTWVGDRAKDVGNFVSNKDEYAKLEELFKHYDQKSGKWDSEENRQAFYKAQNAYNSHPLTAIPDMAKQIGSNISNSKVGEVARDIGDVANNAVSNAKNWVDENITGKTAKELRDRLQSEENSNPGGGYTYINTPTGKKTYVGVDESIANLQKEYDNSLFGKAEKAASDTKKWVDQAGKDVGKAAKNAGDWVGDRASDVKKWGDQAGKDIGKAAKNVGNAVGNAAKDVGKWGKGAVDKGRSFITGLFGKKKK